MDDWKQRTEILVGKDGVERLAAAHVLVVGLGGVGAYARTSVVAAHHRRHANVGYQLHGFAAVPLGVAVDVRCECVPVGGAANEVGTAPVGSEDVVR